jgi:hypothetical protein
MLKVRYWLLTGAAACALSFVQAPASAQPKPKPAAAKPAAKPDADPAKPNLAEAKQRYTAGETKFKAGDFAGALSEFQAADAIKATPQAARYIALCQDKLGKYAEAVTSYERFLADVPEKLKGEADGIKKRVEEIRAMPGKVKVETTPPGAQITADGKPVPQPAPTEIELPPGKHTLLFKLEGREATDRVVDVAYASTQDLKVDMKELPPPPAPAPAPVAKVETPPPPPELPPEPRSMVPAFITGGLAVAAAGVGTAFGIMALSDKSDYDKNPTAEKADDGENHALIADMAFGVAVTMGVTSAVLFLTRDEPAAPKAASVRTVVAARAKSKPVVSAAPIMTPHGGGAGALVRF